MAALGLALALALDVAAEPATSAGAAPAAGAARVAPGMPLERRYTAADYNATPSHYGVVADADGQIYVANVEGLLRFTAGRFELFPLPNRAQVEAVVIGPDGRAYYGGYDYFGYLEESATGEARFHDLAAGFHLPPGESGVGQVWTMVRLEDRVYVQTDDRLFVIHADGHGETFKAPAKMHRLFVVDGRIYVRLDGKGLCRIDGDQFEPIAGAERFAELGVTFVEKRDEGLLILSRDQGFFVADTDGVRPLTTGNDAALKSLEMFTALRLPDGSLAIATRQGDLLRLSADLALIHRYKVASYPLTDLALDQRGGLWVATQGDLVRLEVPSPWSVFTDADGLTGSLADSVWWGGRRWVSSTVGLERSYVDSEGRMRFEKLPWTSYEVWDLEPTRTGLLYAAREALNLVVGDKTQLVAKAQFPSQINLSSFSRDRAYVPFEPGFIVLNQTETGWKEAGRFEPEGMSVGGIVETAPGELWLGNIRGAPQRIKLSADGSRLVERQVLGAAEGLPGSGVKVSYPVQVDEQLLMVMDQRFYAWDGKRFAPSDAGGLATLITRPEELTVRTAPNGTRYAFTSRELLVRKPDDRQWRPLQVESPLARGFTQLSVEADNSVSLIGWNALLSYDPNVVVPPLAPLKTRLYRVRLHQSDNSTQLLDRRAAELSIAPHRSLEVEFGVDTADPGIEYRSELEGLDGGYGEWSKLPRREFAGLAPGGYTLRVEARTAAGRVAEPLSWSFRVEPRWYQTLWTRAALALALLAAGLMLARHYAVRRLHLVEARNRKLEELISERTAELARANRQLARLATLDGLTAIPNRRAFDNFIEHALGRCRERGEPLSLLMLDVDHFKRYNDRHGHLAGDDVLRAIAAELVRFSRGEGEQLARYGGEEFALVLSNAPLPDARRRAEEICAHFRERAGPEGLTISIGVASKIPRTGDTARALIDAADHALYDAKHKGRARVELAAA